MFLIESDFGGNLKANLEFWSEFRHFGVKKLCSSTPHPATADGKVAFNWTSIMAVIAVMSIPLVVVSSNLKEDCTWFFRRENDFWTKFWRFEAKFCNFLNQTIVPSPWWRMCPWQSSSILGTRMWAWDGDRGKLSPKTKFLEFRAKKNWIFGRNFGEKTWFWSEF